MSEILYLAWRYVAYHRGKTATLVGSLLLIVYLPVGLNVLVGQSAAQLTARAEATPLLVGARGSALELVLNSLYLETQPPEATRWAEVERVAESGLADAVPLHVRFRARGHPVVGTTLGYFEFRGLRMAEGRPMAVLGECVVGAEVSRRLGLAAGDSLVTAPESVFDLAGVYPLRMTVTGVLARAHTPDDRAVFIDLKTAWIIQGLGHGHRALDGPDASGDVLAREDNQITANAAVVQYNEITPENAASFHFHGDLSDYPVTAVVALPHDERAGTILMGRYEGAEHAVQIARPVTVMGELLDTILTIRSYVVAAVGVVGLATLATAALVLLLSLRLRRRELETMHKIGASRGRVAAVLVAEVAFVLVLAVALAGGLTLLTQRYGEDLIRSLLIAS